MFKYVPAVSALRAFEASARLGSFTMAAEELGARFMAAFKALIEDPLTMLL